MNCPDCQGRAIPVFYGYVDFAVIERVIIGDLVIGYRYGLEQWACKSCDIRF